MFPLLFWTYPADRRRMLDQTESEPETDLDTERTLKPERSQTSAGGTLSERSSLLRNSGERSA